MSLYGALFSGVSGLQSQSSAMGAISDNVANVNTAGYKGTKVNFQTLVTAQVSVTQYSPGGVQSAPRMNVDIQGLLQATTSSTDFGISGQGFFVVSEQATEPSGYAYSRAGSFKIDKDGYLQNVSGYYLQGWPLESWDGTSSASTVRYNNLDYMKAYKNGSGETFYINDNAVDNVNMQPLNLNTIGGTARASTSLAVGANLPADAAIGTTEKTNALIFDSLGNSHNLLYSWTKRDQNAWDVEVMPPEGSTYITIDDQTSSRRTYFSAGRLDFTDIPAAGTNMTMNINGTNYQFDFSAGTDRNLIDTGNVNTTTVGAAFAAGDTIDINGVTFSLVNTTATDTKQIDISTLTTTAEVAEAVANAAEAYFDNAYGPGYYVEASGSDIQSTFTMANNTGAFTAPFATDYGTDDTFSIDITGRSLSQILDRLGKQVNSAIAKEYGALPYPTPSSWGGRISGENAITFRNPDTTDDITVDASALDGTDGLTAVLQSELYTVPALDSTVAWTLTATSKNYALTFNGNGTPDTMFGSDEVTSDDPRSQAMIGWANGALNMDGSDVASGGSPAISQFWGNYNSPDGMQQLSGDYQLNYFTQDGNRFGNYAGISVSDSGIVTALFDNGVQTPIFMIPVATFVNPNGMNPLTGNVFQQTDSSGLPVVREAGAAGAGKVAQAVLEASNVDLGTEFTNMITTQRAYSAAAKIITTADDMLEELIRIKN